MNPIKVGAMADAESSAMGGLPPAAPGAAGFYGTRYAAIRFDPGGLGGPNRYIIRDEPADEAAVRQFVAEAVGRDRFCLLCELGIADIHSATRAAADRLGFDWRL